MRLFFLITLLSGSGVDWSNCEQITVIGSHFTSNGSNFKLYVAGQDLIKDSFINITLKSGNEFEDFKMIENIDGNLNEELNFVIKPNSQYILDVVHQSKSSGTCKKQTIKIRGLKQSPLILIQTDKPNYHVNDKIKFRILVLDGNMIPYNATKMTVSVIDHKFRFLRKFKDIQLSEYGVYEGYFQIGRDPTRGLWRIQVDLDGNTRTKEFRVSNVEDPFKLEVNSKKIEEKIFLKIHTQHFSGQTFHGELEIFLLNTLVKKVPITRSKFTVELDTEKDLGMHLLKDSKASSQLVVKVIDFRTRKFKKVNIEIGRQTNIENPTGNNSLSSDDYIKASIVSKSQNVGDTIQANVRSNRELRTFHVVVAGSKGIVYTKTYEAPGSDSFNFDLVITEEMKPRSQGMVFSVEKSNGRVIFDSFSIDFGGSGNFLEITTPKSSVPNDLVNFDVRTMANSLVFFSPVDQNTAKLSPDQSPFDIFNVFLAQPIVYGKDCSESIYSEFGTQGQTNFWNFEAIAESDQTFKVTQQVPDAETSWKIYGVTVHPTGGYAITKTAFDLAVRPDIKLKVEVPYDIRMDETVEVKLTVHNYQETDQNGVIDIHIKNGLIVNEHLENASLPINVQAAKSAIKKILIKPSGIGKLIIQAVAATSDGKIKTCAVKSVKVKSKKDVKKAIVGSYLIENGKFSKSVEYKVPEEVDELRFHVIKSNNLLGPIVLDGNAISTNHMGFALENNMDRFGATLIRADYIHSQNQPITEILDEIYVGYQEAVSLYQFDPKTMKFPAQTWWYANLAGLFMSVSKYIDVDFPSIEMRLDIVQNRQEPDGGFSEEPVMDLRRDIGASNIQRHILTAKVAIALARYQEFSQKYKVVLEKSLKFLESTETELTHDYEKSIVAYAYTLSEKKEPAQRLITSMNNKFLESQRQGKDMSMFIETAAYLISAKIELNQDPLTEVKWLTAQRNADGSFYAPYDTVLALRALYEYSVFKNIKSDMNDFEVELTDVEPVEDKILLDVNCRKLCYSTVYYEYTEKIPKNTENYFKVTVEAREINDGVREIAVSIQLKPEEISTTNLVFIEVELPSGYQYLDHDDSEDIQGLNLENDQTKIIYYVEIMEAGLKYDIILRAVRSYNVKNLGNSTIIVYDHYRPNVRDEVHYGIAAN